MMTESNEDVTGVSSIARNRGSSIDVTPSIFVQTWKLNSDWIVPLM